MKRLPELQPEQLSLALEVGEHETPATRPDGASRSVVLGHERLSYRLRRARRRSIGFQIDDAGLTISAPRWVTLREIEAAIAEKHRWIVRKRREWNEWRQRNHVPIMRFRNGATLPYLGDRLLLVLAAAVTARSAAKLQVALPRDATESQVRDAVQSWLQAEARRVLGERIARFADRVSPRYAGWSLSSARSQWGSCTHDGRVRLNWRLIHFALPVIDYVVAHELAHLEHMNHSARFWSAVADLLPGFEPARDAIRGVDMGTLPL